jgi:preprotein translocase SecF subunit
MRILKNPNVNFMDIRKLGYAISGIVLVISLVSLILHGGPKFGIDFRGGAFLEVRFEDKENPEALLDIPINQVRNIFTARGLGSSEIKHYGSNQDISVQLDIETIQGDVDSTLTNLVTELQSEYPQYNVVERRRESVGPKIGRELVWAAVRAILFAMLLILIYIMFRFEFRFGIGAVAALFHDVIITLGIFSLFDIELTIPIIAALLTIIGYSLNDTIVVFDRIRENLKTLKRQVSNYGGIVNRSINETLSRTIVTSGTTLIVVIVLYFFGGEIIKNFAFALICGVIIGTYSSIFIASPILVEWENRKVAKVPVKRR